MADTPMYQTIAEDLRLKIDSGELAPGGLVPPESELITAYNASRNTIREAIRWLKDLGLVKTQPGRGTFVIERPKSFEITLTPDPETGFGGGEGIAYEKEVRAQGREPRISEPQIKIRKASGRIAAELGIPEGTRVVSRHQERFIDETPWSLQTSYYPLTFTQQGAERLLDDDDIPEGTVEYLREQLGIKQASYRDRITVRPPDESEIRFFGLPANGSVSVFQTYRTAMDTQMKPFRLTISVFRTDRNEFLLDVELP